jgi:hypothetical protein
MENLTWAIVAFGTCVGGMTMILGFRQADKELSPGRIVGALKQDWMPTGNIDFRGAVLETSRPQPLRLWVEEERITETVVGQRVRELRWRLATIAEGKKLVICWNARQSSATALLPRPCLVDS